jgi:hypothetical protein
MPSDSALTIQVRLALTKFFKNMNFQARFAAIDDVLKKVQHFQPQQNGYQRPHMLQEMKRGMESVGQIPIAAMLQQIQNPMMLFPVAMILNQLGGLGNMLKQLWTDAKANVTGIDTIHIQFKDNVTRIALKGLDFVQIAPDCPEIDEQQMQQMMGGGPNAGPGPMMGPSSGGADDYDDYSDDDEEEFSN